MKKIKQLSLSENMDSFYKGEKILYEISDKENGKLELPSTILNINTSKKISEVNSKQFGNTVGFVTEPKELRDDDNFISNLKELNIGILRFPGGDGANQDWYNWKEERVDDAWGYTHYYKSPEYLNTDSFFALCRKIGSEGLIVFNYLSSYFKEGAERIAGIFDANAEWAQYIKDNNYPCKYFEFGNEPVYFPTMDVDKHKPKIDPVQYARDYLEMRERLKQIDSSFQLGANMFAYYDGEHWSETSRTWASTFFSIVGQECDFISPHIYYGQIISLNYKTFETQRYDLTPYFNEWREKTKKATGKEIPVYLTEWNLFCGQDKIKLGTFGQGLVEADGLLDIVKSDIKIACIWTLHWYNKRDDTWHPFKDVQYGMLDQSSGELTIPGYTVSELTKEMIGYDVVKTDFPLNDPEINYIALKSKDGRKLKIIAINFSLQKSKNVRFSIRGDHISKITSKTLSAKAELLEDNEPSYSNPSAKTDGNNITVFLEPFSITTILCSIDNKNNS